MLNIRVVCRVPDPYRVSCDGTFLVNDKLNVSVAIKLRKNIRIVNKIAADAICISNSKITWKIINRFLPIK